MKSTLKNLPRNVLLLLAIIIAEVSYPFVAWAVNITVPSAPGIGYVLVSTTTGAYITTAPSTSGYVLTSNGASAIPTFQASVSGSGTISTSSPLVSGQSVYATGVSTIASAANMLWNNATSLLTITGNASTTQIGSTGSAYFATSGGNVGIGTTSPSFLLSVGHAAGTTDGNALFSGTVYANNFYDTSVSGSTCIGETNGLIGTSNCVASLASSGGSITVSSPTGAVNIDLPSISNGVLGSVVSAIPSRQATSTLYGTAPQGGYVLGWNNNTNGIGWIATSTGVYTGTYPISVSGTTISTAFGTTTNIGIGNNLVLYTGATGIPQGVSTSTIGTFLGSQSAGVLGTAATGLLSMQGTTTLYGALGTAGYVLMSSGGNAIWAATSSSSGGASFGQTLSIDSSNWISATTTGTYGINANAQGLTYGYGIGDQLLAYASSTNQDTIFGLGAGGQNATTSNSVLAITALGYQALNANTGTNNTAIGYQALETNTSGGNNTAVGYQALNANLTTSSNTAFGYTTLKATTNSQNSGFGAFALLVNTSGTNNAAFGYNALGASILGSNNSAFGASSLSAVTGTNNTAFGYKTGVNVTTGYDNLFLGETQNTGGNAITTGGGNIGLGYNIVYPSASQNLMLNIGNSFFGNLVATSTSTSVPTSFTGVTFGIASSSPQYYLSVGSMATAFYVSSTGEVVGYDKNSGDAGQITPMRFPGFKIATTTWVGTTTIGSNMSADFPAPFTGKFSQIMCYTDAGTVTVEMTDGSTHVYLPNASTTVGFNTFSASFTFGDKIDFTAGNPSSSPTFVTCIPFGYQTP